MNSKVKYILMAMIYFTTACSSIPKGTLLGATVGLGVGGIVANGQDDNSQKNTSLAAGALIGGVIGYFLSDDKIKKERELKAAAAPKDFAPKLNRPEVRRVWVPDQISGDEYISGHWKFLIDKNAVWSKSEEE
jgi:hypothetical protein